jgi:hypothetical protein
MPRGSNGPLALHSVGERIETVPLSILPPRPYAQAEGPASIEFAGYGR